MCVCVCVCVCGGGGGGATGGASSLQIFGRFAQGYAETVHFVGISSLENWVKKIFVF